MELQPQLTLAKQLALTAGSAIMTVYRQPFKVSIKEDRSPLTEADTRANAIILDGLRKGFPGYAILSEEAADDRSRLKNDWCWIVDPLDGTKEFINKNGEFTVNIALAYQHRVVVGVVYAPARGELYYAAQDQGAFLVAAGETRRIFVSDRQSGLRLAVSRSHLSTQEQKLIEAYPKRISEVIKSGSSIKGCLVARGDAELYYRYNPTMEWDTAAMQCVVEEAGGLMRQMDGTELLYNREESRNSKGFYVVNREENKLG